MSTNAYEAGLYEFVQYLTNPSKAQRAASMGQGLRRAPREMYPCFQPIAPYVDGRLPRPEEFRDVRCLDLAQGGIAFLDTEPPADRSVIIALGSGPDVSYVSAEVVHETTATIIGCRFTGRIHL